MKIKTADEFRYTGAGGKYFTYGKVYVATSDETEDGWFTVNDDTGLDKHNWQNDDEFWAKFEKAKSPVRTTVKRVVIDGTYGRLSVGGLHNGECILGLLDRGGNPVDRGNFSAKEIRDVALYLMDISDAL